ncbi:unnamed protein product [Bursaphelenchus okinawaensis]|uniref:Glutathione S-transferase n=1 Tax=Bursaphelenchus okinawaensis TaxID=465554 RepID=A0A811KL49_9BILA|nr:unnamed protein product [Bursaphelenchus okinawaensis]CAG9105681.1 unnamed protein product [Bursaphelenchus okinawaensis]
MVQYTLLYGDNRGLAEPARMLFSYANVKFEDDRSVTPETMEKIRDQLPFGQVPVLTIDGKVKLAQSKAIFRFLGRKFGLAGKDEIEQALVDSYGDFIQDLITNTWAYFLCVIGRPLNPKDDKEKLAKEAQTYIDTKWKKYFDKVVKESGSGFMAKSGVTWVDFLLANFYENAAKYDLKPFTSLKNMKTIYDNVKALPQLKNYYATRKEPKPN